MLAALAALGGRSAWQSLHLLLAGGAGTAIASVMPFFSASLAAATPVHPVARAAVVGAVASGALAVSAAIPAGITGVALAGG